MPDKETLQRAGDYILEGPLIAGSSGNNYNFDSLITELNIFQDIDSPYMSGSIFVTDTSGLYEQLPIFGQERLLFTLRTPGANNTVDFSDYHGAVFNVSSRNPSGNREHSYNINFTTLEGFRNLRTKISKSFKGSIAGMVVEIMKDEDMLGTPKAVMVDPTQNVRKYVSPNLRPFQIIQYLKEEAINEKGEPHYLFYENPDGFHFRSLDSLLGELRELSVEAVQEYKLQPPMGTRSIGDNMQSIQGIKLLDSTNTYSNTKAGMFGSTLYQHDILIKSISKYVFDYNTAFNTQNATNQETGEFGPMASDIKVDGKKKIWEFPDSRIFVHPSASTDLHHEGSSTEPEYVYTHNNAELWMQESISRELEREYFTIQLDLFGDTDIMVGQIIHLTIPSNRGLGKDESSEALDPILSGRYLITQLRHKIDINAGTHVMVVTAMKDSVIKQTEALKLFNFPEPPQIPSMKIPELPKMPRPKLPSFKFPKITFGGFSSLF